MGYYKTDEFPWQRITSREKLELAFPLAKKYDEELLVKETKELFLKYAPKEQHGRYHKGGWNGICLHAAYGDVGETRLIKDAPYKKTEALDSAPYFESIIDELPGDKKRIRLMALEPEKNIFWHIDEGDSLDEARVRLHIPIITNAKVHFQISHLNCEWEPGTLYYGDFSFPHRLYNESNIDRVHLVIDIDVNQEIEGLFKQEFIQNRERRKRIKEDVRKSFFKYDRWDKNKDRLRRLFSLKRRLA